MESTNYFNTFIEIAEDCPAKAGEIPPVKGDKKSIANLQYDMLFDNPYKFTSDDILYTVFAMRKEIPERELEVQRQVFFSKGQPCFRSSPLTKRYGWGIHSNEEGKVAMYGVGTEAYRKFVSDGSIKKTKAMRSKRA
ncbi:DUF6157 family protein [Fulvivirgaceae bacterium BMA12]|uniref:DUF6157 family protein n=1 Tax=Agaribacillus aureus TaxID=3051825 RepID=A0ABT8LGN0_9BACT|nr:DUF6157 family protein [Fulvivirgaceae bacterium BMA12]